MALHQATPLIESLPLSRPGQQAFLKLEAVQPGGSFKIRGIGRACELQAARGCRRFVCASGGNAGLAVAYSGRQLRIPVLVVVPETTSERAIQLLQTEGAEVLVQGPSFAEAHTHALTLMSSGDAYIHPYDDQIVWQGHATLVDELVAERVAFDGLVLSVGGGGLLCGLLEGLHRHHLQQLPVFAVETVGAAALNLSIRQGQRVSLPAIDSIASSLGAKQICERAWEWLHEHEIHSLTVTDAEALNACRRFLDDHRLLVEPACGATLAAGYLQSPELQSCERLVYIVCGGSGVTLEQLMADQPAVIPSLRATD